MTSKVVKAFQDHITSMNLSVEELGELGGWCVGEAMRQGLIQLGEQLKGGDDSTD